MKARKIFFFFFLILALASCVSKKKYMQLQTNSELAENENNKKNKLLSNYNDSLILAMNQKDSIIDSLNLKLNEFNQKKDPQKITYNDTYVKKNSTLTKEQEYNKKAVYIYNFSKNIEWPKTYNGIEFIIGVVGDETVLKELTKVMTGKKVGGKKIIVKEFDKESKYNIIFIDSGHCSSFNSIKNFISKNKTLLVTDDPSLKSSGAHISFVIEKDKIRFLINKPGIERSGMKVSEELMRFAG